MELSRLLAALLLVAGAQAQNRDSFDFFRPPNRGRLLPPSRRLDVSGVRGLRTDFRSNNFINFFGQRPYEIQLRGSNNSREGNVEVLFFDWRELVAGWRSVCDYGWTTEHAKAVCRQLGFPGNAVATHNGRFGMRSNGMGSMVNQCQIGEGNRGLRNCLHAGLGTAAATCGSNNIAGVICGDDPASPYNGRMAVRLRGGGTKGDIEVKYGDRGWGPICGDGFDLKDGTVVCKQLNLGAAKRTSISGRRARGPFILAGVECTGREANLAQCKSIRDDPVSCPGNRYSGAAVECTGPEDIRLPDLRVDAGEVQASARLSTERLADLTCAAEENCLARSASEVMRTDRNWKLRTRKLFRFTNKVWNNGGADYKPKADPAQWEWHTCHEHYHSEESFSEYDLTYAGTDEKAAEGHKASFCLEDSECKRGISQRYFCYIEQNVRPPQGIRAGCADIYGDNIDCQWIDVTDIKSGRYVLRIRVNADRKVPEVSFDDNQVICNVRLNMERDEVRITNCRNAPL
uniref:Lysyl oxidase n=1 Tax=Megabalanus rosa TaxID=6680 RepID=A0A8D5RUN7_MEGRO|nr:Lysyl oxidase [Megabalanus rosa]